MSNQNNKPNLNMFNNKHSVEQQELLKQMRTVPLIKHIVAFLTGFVPMIIAIFLFGTDDIVFGQWQNIEQLVLMSYGELWAIGFGVVFLSVVLVLLVIKFNKDVKIDVVPFTTTWSTIMFSLFIIPLPHNLLWLEVILVPIFGIIGFVLGIFGVMIYSITKFAKEMQKIQEQNGGENPFDFVNQQNPGSFNKPLQPKSNPSPKKPKPKDEDNPFVDIEEDE